MVRPAARGDHSGAVPLHVGDARLLQRRQRGRVAVCAIVHGMVVGHSHGLDGILRQAVYVSRGAMEHMLLLHGVTLVAQGAFQIHHGELVAREIVDHVGEGIGVVIAHGLDKAGFRVIVGRVAAEGAVPREGQKKVFLRGLRFRGKGLWLRDLRRLCRNHLGFRRGRGSLGRGVAAARQQQRQQNADR